MSARREFKNVRCRPEFEIVVAGVVSRLGNTGERRHLIVFPPDMRVVPNDDSLGVQMLANVRNLARIEEFAEISTALAAHRLDFRTARSGA